jgi:uncharacterized protein YaaW (UPF0174 family)
LTQFHIPIYQRTYTWEADNQVDKLIDDIIEFGAEYKDNKRAEYYIGNVIVKNQTRGLITERVVIDGQQRITTSILMLCAIRDIYRNKFISDEGDSIASNIHNSLYIKDGNDIKLKLNNMENQQSLTNLLSASEHSATFSDKQTRYVKNYEHIYKRLSRMGENVFKVFLELLKRVKVVIIFLDEDQDENSVFESINSLGKPLAGSDLIKNYVFTFKNYECSHQDETSLTNLYTRTFEGLFKHEKDVEGELESFFRVYIGVMSQSLVKLDPKIIYYSFKKLVGEITSIDSCRALIADLSKWAIIYQALKNTGHPDIDANSLGYLRPSLSTYSTFLMRVVDEFSHIENGELIIDDKDQVNGLLKQFVAYDASRFIAGFPDREILRFVPTLFARLNTERYAGYERLADKFYAFVSGARDGYRQPDVMTLKKSVLTNDLYTRQSKKLKRLLILIENIGKKEILDYEKDLKKAQIEHIVPQTIAPGTWQSISKEEHSEYLHTLGNLTLTFDNQKLSNLPFSEKKSLLQQQSRMKMNNALTIHEDFAIPQVKQRALTLLDEFLQAYVGEGIFEDVA